MRCFPHPLWLLVAPSMLHTILKCVLLGPSGDTDQHTFYRFQASSQLLLSPPDSINGSGTTSGYSTLSTFAHTTLPKPHVSNVSSSDNFNGVSGGLLSSSWGDASMTGYERHKAYAVHYAIPVLCATLTGETFCAVQPHFRLPHI